MSERAAYVGCSGGNLGLLDGVGGVGGDREKAGQDGRGEGEEVRADAKDKQAPAL